MKAREQKEASTGKKPGGKPPSPPQAGPRAHDQVNLTDEQSRIMKTGVGFDQCYNAQAITDTESMLIMAAQVTQACNDKQQIVPMLQALKANGVSETATLLADTGYYSEHNVQACLDTKITPLIAVKRDEHHPAWRERFEEPDALTVPASPVEQMKHMLKTKAGRAAYALRKQTVEPVFGIIKSVMGFRQFLLRGIVKVQAEWTLVCLAWNLKRMAVLRPQ